MLSTASHLRASSLITVAHQLQPYQLLGAPDWVRSTFYDINANPAEKATRDQTFVMLQGLLVDRFKLEFHRETRQVDGYTLVRVLVIGHANGPVTDETGLTGTYDIELKWSNDVAPADDATTIFMALQEQLGLKFERHRVSAEVFVVDHLGKAMAD